MSYYKQSKLFLLLTGFIMIFLCLPVVAQVSSQDSVAQVEPTYEDYLKLKEALVLHQNMQKQGGWAKVEGKEAVKPNDKAKVILAVRKRLFPQQKINPADSALYIYDQDLANAVKDFQTRHGLEADGILGPNTYKAMNVSVEDRINQIVLNLERWKAMPDTIRPDSQVSKYVMVNIPAFRVYVMENGKEVMQMRAVVGKSMYSTPVFSNEIQYLTFAPYWNVPNIIVERDIKPKLIKDPNWLESRNMEMVDNFGPNAKVVPVSKVDWKKMTEENFQYRIRQKPGPKNELGRVKFMFPNEHEVYLHDTPAEHLFDETGRGYSSGCVRIEKPEDLAVYLLQNKSGWDRAAVEKAMNATEQQDVSLEENVPVYLVYFTAFVDNNGAVHFRDDIYGHDKAMAQKLGR